MNALLRETASSFESVHGLRRARLVQALQREGGGLALIPTAPLRQRNGDNDFPYRYDSHFH